MTNEDWRNATKAEWDSAKERMSKKEFKKFKKSVWKDSEDKPKKHHLQQALNSVQNRSDS